MTQDLNANVICTLVSINHNEKDPKKKLHHSEVWCKLGDALENMKKNVIERLLSLGYCSMPTQTDDTSIWVSLHRDDCSYFYIITED